MAQKQELEGWRNLSERYRRPLLVFFLKKTGNYSDSEDLVHEVFLKLLGDKQDVPFNENSYVFTVAMNVLRDRFRRDIVRTRHLLEVGQDEAGRSDSLTPERILLSKQEIDRMMAALAEMSERSREIFVLFRFEKMSQHDIATKFGISASAVEKNVARVMMHLKRSRSQ